jgi:Ser/Thr protein kinase RdoA (MazF antagonist)
MHETAAADLFTAAARQAIAQFPVDLGDITLVAVSENVTFRVTDRKNGAAYALRLHRPGYHSLEELESERLWTRALAEAGIAVPQSVAARDGRYYVPVDILATGETRMAGLLRWTRGEVLDQHMARTPNTAALPGWFEQLGALLAAMHAQASAWRPPAIFTRHHLDADGLLGEAPFWGRFWEHPALSASERDLMLARREAIRAALDRYGKSPAIYSVIHADLHPGNILIDEGRLTAIDFDDTGHGWHMYDAAVALMHHQAQPYFPAVREALFRGYRSARALSPRDEAMLPMFLLIRGMAVIGWLYQRPEHASADHIAYLQRVRRIVRAQCEAFEAPC